jgi:hypothetical protein
LYIPKKVIAKKEVEKPKVILETPAVDTKNHNLPAKNDTVSIKKETELITSYKQNGDESWVNPRKKAILIDYVANPNEAKKLAKSYENHDIYVYNTIKDKQFCCAVYVVNVDGKKLNPVLDEIKKVSSKAKKISNARTRYFSLDISPDNMFIPAKVK